MRTACSAGVIIMALAGTVCFGEEAWERAITEALERRISCEFDNTPLVEAAMFFGALLGHPVVVDEEARRSNARITCRLKGVSLLDAMAALEGKAGLSHRLVDHVYVMAPAEKLHLYWRNTDEDRDPAGAGMPQAAAAALARDVAFEFVDTPVEEAFLVLQNKTRISVVVDTEAAAMLAGRTVTMRSGGMPAAAALRWVVNTAGLTHTWLDSVYFVSSEERRRYMENLWRGMPVAAGTGDETVEKTFDKLGKNVSFEFVDTGFAESIELLKTLTKVEMELDNIGKEAAARPVTLRLTNVPLLHALRWICRLNGLDYMCGERGLRICAPEIIASEAAAWKLLPGESAGKGRSNMPASAWRVWAKLQEKCSLTVTKTTITQALDEFAEASGVPVLVHFGQGEGKRAGISLDMKDRPGEEILRALVKEGELDYELMDGVCFVAKPGRVGEYRRKWTEIPVARGDVRSEWVEKRLEWMSKPVSFNLRNAECFDTLEFMQSAADVNIWFSPLLMEAAAGETVDWKADRIPTIFALRWLARIAGGDLMLGGGAVQMRRVQEVIDEGYAWMPLPPPLGPDCPPATEPGWKHRMLDRLQRRMAPTFHNALPEEVIMSVSQNAHVNIVVDMAAVKLGAEGTQMKRLSHGFTNTPAGWVLEWMEKEVDVTHVIVNQAYVITTEERKGLYKPVDPLEADRDDPAWYKAMVDKLNMTAPWCDRTGLAYLTREDMPYKSGLCIRVSQEAMNHGMQSPGLKVFANEMTLEYMLWWLEKGCGAEHALVDGAYYVGLPEQTAKYAGMSGMAALTADAADRGGAKPELPGRRISLDLRGTRRSDAVNIMEYLAGMKVDVLPEARKCVDDEKGVVLWANDMAAGNVARWIARDMDCELLWGGDRLVLAAAGGELGREAKGWAGIRGLDGRGRAGAPSWAERLEGILDTEMTCEFVRTPFLEGMKYLSKEYGFNLAVMPIPDDGRINAPVTLKLRKVRLRDFIDGTCRLAGVDWSAMDGFVTVWSCAPWQHRRWSTIPAADGVDVKKAMAAAAGLMGDRVSFNFESVHYEDVLEFLTRYSGERLRLCNDMENDRKRIVYATGHDVPLLLALRVTGGIAGANRIALDSEGAKLVRTYVGELGTSRGLPIPEAEEAAHAVGKETAKEGVKEAAMEPIPRSRLFRVATYNVQDEDVSDERTRELMRVLVEVDADIIALQEVTPQFMGALARQPWLSGYRKFTEEGKPPTDPGGEMILSREPVRRVEYTRLPGKDGRWMLAAHTTLDGKPLVVGIVNLEAALEAGQTRAMQLGTAFGRLGPGPDAILAGSFNFGDGERENSHLAGDYVDVWRTLRQGYAGYTWDMEKNERAKAGAFAGEKSRRLDRILFRSKRLNPVDVELIGNRLAGKDGGTYPSDHFGVAVTFLKTGGKDVGGDGEAERPAQ
ncbi:MAG: endonuclease/exonuclease/phosphatase family protein [Planctomycetes bacterium]|nr:endonuclease/exonuclease/phosphatase family protein [Planctomycetota bacterium]